MITVLTGANSSALRQKVADLKKAFTEQYSASGIEQFDGEALQVQDLPDQRATHLEFALYR